MRIHPLFIVPLILALAGCSVSRAADEEMYKLASPLTKLTAAVESSVRYKNPPRELSDTELLRFATQHDPALLSPFRAYVLKVLNSERHAVVLVCTEDGQQALLEDAGCTAKLDVHRWRMPTKTACEFTITVADVCSMNPR